MDYLDLIDNNCIVYKSYEEIMNKNVKDESEEN